jgi:4-hydroxythreonine-4-phosphate dehydrogenase
MAGVLILADDLTGAADCAAAFLRTASEVVVALDERARLDAPVLAIDLNTRNLSMEEACAKVERAFGRRRARNADFLFKKIDSTLRGNVGSELRAARKALGAQRPILLAPAFPAQGRTVRNGRVHVNGKPLRGGNLAHLANDGNVTVCDAQTDSELRAIARKGLALKPRPLFVGSAGLARALAAALPRRRKARRARLARGPIAVVVGSASRTSIRQAKRLAPVAKREGIALYRLEWTRAPTAADTALVHAFGRIAARHPDCAAYVLTGGETARAVLGTRGVRGFRLLGEVEPGVPFGVSIPAGLAVCTKAGGFGGPDTLVHCVARLKREMRSS